MSTEPCLAPAFKPAPYAAGFPDPGKPEPAATAEADTGLDAPEPERPGRTPEGNIITPRMIDALIGEDIPASVKYFEPKDSDIIAERNIVRPRGPPCPALLL